MGGECGAPRMARQRCCVNEITMDTEAKGGAVKALLFCLVGQILFTWSAVDNGQDGALR